MMLFGDKKNKETSILSVVMPDLQEVEAKEEDVKKEGLVEAARKMIKAIAERNETMLAEAFEEAHVIIDSYQYEGEEKE